MDNNKLHNNNDFYLAKWLEGSITDEALKEFVSEEDFLIYKKIYQGLLVFEDLERPITSSFKDIQEKIQQRKRSKIKQQMVYWSISVAASFLIIFGLYSTFKGQTTIIETSFAEQINITLLDGSEMTINAKSEVSYNKKEWKSKREVYLQGEAFFKVKEGSTFTVTTNRGSVIVLGTMFNVISNNDYFEVVCYEGKVKVINNNSEYILTPTKAFRIINGNSIENWNSEKELPTWISGESSFKSVPLKYVISALERQYNLHFDSSKIDDSLIFTGSFSHKNLEIALASVFKTMHIHYKNKGNNVFVLSLN